MSTICIGDEYFDEFWNPDNDDRPDFFDVGGDTFEYAPGRSRQFKWHDGVDPDLLTDRDSLLYSEQTLSALNDCRESAALLAALVDNAIIGIVDRRQNRNATIVYALSRMKRGNAKMPARKAARRLQIDKSKASRDAGKFVERKKQLNLETTERMALCVLTSFVDDERGQYQKALDKMDNIRMALRGFETAIMTFWWERRPEADPLLAWAWDLCRGIGADAIIGKHRRTFDRQIVTVSGDVLDAFRRHVDREQMLCVTRLTEQLIKRIYGGVI